MTDDAVVPDDGRKLCGAVNDRAILDRRSLPDADGPVVAAQHRLRPDRRPGTHGDVPDDRRIGMDPGLRVQRRHETPERIDSHRRDGSLHIVLDTATIEKHAAAIDRNGYTILERVIEPDLLDALTEDLHRLETLFEITPANDSFEGDRTLRVYNLLAFGKLYEAIPIHEQVLPLVEQVLDPGCLVSSLSSICLLYT